MTQLDTGPPVESGPGVPGGTETRRLTRSRSDNVVAGVCAGLGSYFGVDPFWFRMAFIVLTLGGGAGVLIYVIAWLAMAEPNGLESGADVVAARGPVIAGAVLVTVGIMLFFNNLVPWFDEVMWPLVIVAAGIGLIVGVRRHHDR